MALLGPLLKGSRSAMKTIAHKLLSTLCDFTAKFGGRRLRTMIASTKSAVIQDAYRFIDAKLATKVVANLPSLAAVFKLGASVVKETLKLGQDSIKKVFRSWARYIDILKN